MAPAIYPTSTRPAGRRSCVRQLSSIPQLHNRLCPPRDLRRGQSSAEVPAAWPWLSGTAPATRCTKQRSASHACPCSVSVVPHNSRDNGPRAHCISSRTSPLNVGMSARVSLMRGLTVADDPMNKPTAQSVAQSPWARHRTKQSQRSSEMRRALRAEQLNRGRLGPTGQDRQRSRHRKRNWPAEHQWPVQPARSLCVVWNISRDRTSG